MNELLAPYDRDRQVESQTNNASVSGNEKSVPVDADDSSPILVRRPSRQTLPVVVASPHSGRNYPKDFVADAALDLLPLRSSEDAHVDRLVEAAPKLGAPLLAALFPRVYVDPNREPYELDPAMFHDQLPDHVVTRNGRIAAGLGTVPRVVANQRQVYNRKLAFIEAEQRIRTCYRPYHQALKQLIEETRERFGFCILLDCHSMPSSAVAPQPRELKKNQDGKLSRRIDIVLGDCHGTSSDPRIVELIEGQFQSHGLLVRRNHPYAGGFITRHYGRPAKGVHTVQIEMNRALYLDEATMEITKGATRLSHNMSAVISGLGVLLAGDAKLA